MRSETGKNHRFVALWITVLFLQFQVVRSLDVTYLTAKNGTIKSNSYPQKLPQGYHHEWQIKAPTGYRIRLYFKYFYVGDCTSQGDQLEVWTGPRDWITLCGQRLPPIIESTGKELVLYFSGSYSLSSGSRFWAYYERFKEGEFKTTSKPYTLTTTKVVMDTGDPASDGNGSGKSSNQRLYLLVSVMGCIFILVVVTLYCGCRKLPPLPRQSQIPNNTPNNVSEIQDTADTEFNFHCDAPPSYDEVTRQSSTDVSGITQQPSRESTAIDIPAIDSSGLPSYEEALRLSQQSLAANV